ncbi:hypothetical protein [Streptomyces sp. BR123]|uniref:transmembrane-type terpene cyclase n=1 Tax=Streptomyces sp. BR123 TaxID=2749828 RepID=UPI00211B39B7|nr:hypothetical protein [Streptomyces sp. BR123]
MSTMRNLRLAASQRAGRMLASAVTQVAPPIRRGIEATIIEGLHGPVLGSSPGQQLRATPVRLTARYLAFAVKRARLAALAPEPVGGNLSGHLARIRDAGIEKALTRLCARIPDGARAHRDVTELAEVEFDVRRGSAKPEQLRRLLELAPAELRLVRDLGRPWDRDGDEELRETLRPAETLAYVAWDLKQYAGGTRPIKRTNLYAAFVDAYGDAAAERLREEVARLEAQFEAGLRSVGAADRERLERAFTLHCAPLRDDFPEPAADHHEEEGAAEGVSSAVVLFGMLCAVGWLVAYVAVVYRGFADQTYGVPLAAFFANLTWEFAYGFLLDPLGDYFHTASIFGFLVDAVIAWQVWKYGAAQFPNSVLGRYFRPIFGLCVAAALSVNYHAFIDLADPDGEYTGFGINLMMSILYLKMLEDRGSPEGQSMYIAIGKWLGTLCAWIATALTVTTSPQQTWPTSWSDFTRKSLGSRSYPLTPLINVMYGWTFLLDVAYCVLLHRSIKAAGMSPWRRL